MKYTSFGQDAQIGHLKNRLLGLEQEHYSTIVSIELFTRLKEEDSSLCRKEKEKLISLEKIYAELETLLKELEAEAPETTDGES